MFSRDFDHSLYLGPTIKFLLMLFNLGVGIWASYDIVWEHIFSVLYLRVSSNDAWGLLSARIKLD